MGKDHTLDELFVLFFYDEWSLLEELEQGPEARATLIYWSTFAAPVEITSKIKFQVYT